MPPRLRGIAAGERRTAGAVRLGVFHLAAAGRTSRWALPRRLGRPGRESGRHAVSQFAQLDLEHLAPGPFSGQLAGRGGSDLPGLAQCALQGGLALLAVLVERCMDASLLARFLTSAVDLQAGPVFDGADVLNLRLARGNRVPSRVLQTAAQGGRIRLQ